MHGVERLPHTLPMPRPGEPVVRRLLSPAFLLTELCRAIAIVALLDLAVRSAVLLDPFGYDSFFYHLPFAALRGGIPLPYDMNDTVRAQFDAFPPLPELVQGLLWRVTGSVNATGVVNFIAFAVFLAYAHRVLRAPFWLMASPRVGPDAFCHWGMVRIMDGVGKPYG